MRETFIRWYIYQLKTYDCDPSIYVMKYIVNRMELNIEQKYWLCWLYANTYQVPTAWVIFNEFPDFENVDLNRLKTWNEKNYKKLCYQNDQKWLKGHLPSIFEAYQKRIQTKGSQYRYFEHYRHPEEPYFYMGEYHYHFDNLYTDITKNFYKFGRYTAWFYMQALKEICGLNLTPTSLKLKDESSASPRAGLCYALNKPEWTEKKRKFSKEEIAYLEQEARKLLGEIDKKFSLTIENISIDFFSLETSLCSFKKLFRSRNGRYLGYYLDRFSKDIQNTSAHDWFGINWDLLWEARDEILFKQLNNRKIDNEKMLIFMENGQFSSAKYPKLQEIEKNLQLYFGL